MSRDAVLVSGAHWEAQCIPAGLLAYRGISGATQRATQCPLVASATLRRSDEPPYISLGVDLSLRARERNGRYRGPLLAV
jgi:hypothetical protein